MDDISKKLNKVFDNVNNMEFNDIYGGTSLLAGIIISIVIFRIIYTQVIVNSHAIKKDWDAKRCYPHIIPFAGIINPQKGRSFIDTTADNFAYCIDGVLGKIVGKFLKPGYMALSSISSLIDIIANMINSIRKRMTDAMNKIFGIFNEVITIVKSSFIPIQELLLRMRDTLQKTLAVGVTSLYTLLAPYLTMMSFFRNYLNIMVKFMVISAATIVGLIAFPFTTPVGLSLLAIFTPIYAIMGPITYYLAKILDEKVRLLPKKPACFGGSTELELYDGIVKPIHTIQPGDILRYDGRVNSVLQLSIQKQTMFYLPNFKLYISGTHEVVYNKKWMTISDIYTYQKQLQTNDKSHTLLNILMCDGIEHKKYDSPYIYCINTESGYIHIPSLYSSSNNTQSLICSDWNDIEPYEYQHISSVYVQPITKAEHIHKYLEGGFTPYTKLQLQNGKYELIQRINIGDVLSCGSKVTGIVEGYCNDIELYKHNVFGTIIIGATNNIIDVNSSILPQIPNQLLNKNIKITNDNSNNIVHKLSLHSFRKNKLEKNKYPRYIYHLITDTHTFMINDIKFNDYYSCTENYLPDN